MKYVVVRISISIEGGVPIFSSCDTQLLDERHSAVYKAMRMFKEDINEMESMACLESSYYQHSTDDKTIVEAKICSKCTAIIIIVKAIDESEVKE